MLGRGRPAPTENVAWLTSGETLGRESTGHGQASDLQNYGLLNWFSEGAMSVVTYYSCNRKLLQREISFRFSLKKKKSMSSCCGTGIKNTTAAAQVPAEAQVQSLAWGNGLKEAVLPQL